MGLLRVFWKVRTHPVTGLSETSEGQEDARVKCVGGDKTSLTLPLWISCFLFIVALDCHPMEIANFDLWFQRNRSTSCKGYHIVLAPHHVTLWRHWLCFFSLSGSSQTVACWQQLGSLGCSSKFPSKKLWFGEESHTFWEAFCVHTFVNTKSRSKHWKGDACRLCF